MWFIEDGDRSIGMRRPVTHPTISNKSARWVATTWLKFGRPPAEGDCTAVLYQGQWLVRFKSGHQVLIDAYTGEVIEDRLKPVR